MTIRPERIRILTPSSTVPVGEGAVVYWMNRDRRVHDNWALLHAQHIALDRRVPLRVVVCIAPSFLDATLRQYDFMLRGIEELHRDLDAHGIGFDLLAGDPVEEILAYVQHVSPCLVVTDFEPLRITMEWTEAVAQRITAPFHQVDAHNVVPAWHVTQKTEFAAYTIRPKINRLLPTFLEEFPAVVRHPFVDAVHAPSPRLRTMDEVRASLRVDTAVGPVSWITPGESAARAALESFVGHIDRYRMRNDPTKPGQSNLSPWLHFGHLAPQRAALAAASVRTASTADAVDAFLEELIVRRELADNFTFTNPQYDRFDGFPAWAQRTLNDHRTDPRDHTYTLEEWEGASTHDLLWNAAQRELIHTGKLHGYMRMYWAKKLLEWSATPEEALAIGIHLNDRYELDGCDPNGYVGVAWSIGGVHDRAWFERPVYGKIRYMNANGCASKFDVKGYIRRYANDTLL
jgi:deoxyribodipyrimidine photo-lyase